MATSTFVPRPTLPGLRTAGGSGFEVIWCDASVIAYASSTGAPNRASRPASVTPDSAALQERMKRKPDCAGRASLSARVSRIWWIVGAAEYQVTRYARATGQKVLALKRGGVTIVPPAYKGASVEPTRPWTW